MEDFDIRIYAETMALQADKSVVYYGVRLRVGKQETEYPSITQDREWLQQKVDMLLQADLFPCHLCDCLEDIAAEAMI